MSTLNAEPETRSRLRYDDALRHLPATGAGCHPALLSVANIGRRAGLSAEEIAVDLGAHVHGTREVTEGEIWDAVEKAFLPGEPLRRTTLRTAPRTTINASKLMAHILARGAGFTLDRLGEASPVPITWGPEDDARAVLARLYSPDDKLFVGEKYGKCVRPVSDWVARFRRGEPVPPHIIPNPLSGELGRTKKGKPSYRADACVACFRFAVVEFDKMPLDQQILFWAGAKLPVAALIFSGSKSIHGWVRVDAVNGEDWTRRVEQKLFDMLTPLGADRTCKNEARLSRMPGHFRGEKNQWQRLLYLAPAGRPVQP